MSLWGLPKKGSRCCGRLSLRWLNPHLCWHVHTRNQLPEEEATLSRRLGVLQPPICGVSGHTFMELACQGRRAASKPLIWCGYRCFLPSNLSCCKALVKALAARMLLFTWLLPSAENYYYLSASPSPTHWGLRICLWGEERLIYEASPGISSGDSQVQSQSFSSERRRWIFLRIPLLVFNHSIHSFQKKTLSRIFFTFGSSSFTPEGYFWIFKLWH